MEDLSTQELRALVKRHAPEVFRDNASGQDRFILMLMAGIIGYTVGALLGTLLAPAALWPTIVLCTVAGPLVVRVRTGPNPQPSRVSMYSALGAAFRRQIEQRRAELLGPRSEAGMARQALVDALQEASRSRAYWTARLRQDDASGLARQELPIAEALVSKFESALAALDRRHAVLRDFLNDCEARISALESVGRDWQEVERLRGLASRADEVVNDANAAVNQIATGFLREAQRVAEALGAAEIEQLKDVAAEVPLSRIEDVADRIIEHSTREEHELQSLVDRLSETIG